MKIGLSGWPTRSSPSLAQEIREWCTRSHPISWEASPALTYPRHPALTWLLALLRTRALLRTEHETLRFPVIVGHYGCGLKRRGILNIFSPWKLGYRDGPSLAHGIQWWCTRSHPTSRKQALLLTCPRRALARLLALLRTCCLTTELETLRFPVMVDYYVCACVGG